MYSIMWKNYSRFYKEILYSEISLLTKISGVHQIGNLQKIILILRDKKSSGIKKALLYLSCLHLVVDFKGKLIGPKNRISNLRQKKNLTFGSSIILRKRYCFPFLFFSLFHLLGRSNPLGLISYPKDESSFCLMLPCSRSLNRIEFSRTFFQEIGNAQVLFLFNSSFKETSFSLRFLKFPIKSL